MPQSSIQPDREALAGIERVTYHNAETGFYVQRRSAAGRLGVLTHQEAAALNERPKHS